MYEKDAWTEEMGSDSIENIKTRENTGFNVSFKWDVFLKLKGYPYKFKKKKSASFHA
ncbi:hypothetical protein [Methyloprofundus sp.]|uniref:hypothetical protein n=1 Tax=Methyloprofundus sp. TaxID=2020875 RepID=UPI003D0D870D